MKKIVLVLLLLAGSLAAQQPAAPPAESSAADRDHAAFLARLREEPPAPPKEMGNEKFLTWLDAHLTGISAAGLAFYEAHPQDPRRWTVILRATQQPPLFAKGYGPDVATKGARAIIVDEAAKAAWEQKVEKLKQALLDSSDAAIADRESVEWARFGRDFQAIAAARRKDESAGFDALRARFDAHVARYGALDVVANRAADYLGALESNVPGSTEAIWRQLLATPHAALRAMAEERLKFFDLLRKPLDIAFTAVDGRPVDLKNLRGKVVLVDFWATWCGPCIAELPNVKEVYAAYHDKGFEIVGIALENGSLRPTDTAEQKAAKLEKAKKVLTDFTTKENMPWPQYFDGKYWLNDISRRYDIQGIPAMFLLDQEGRVVTTNARGEKLGADVKRLLKL